MPAPTAPVTTLVFEVEFLTGRCVATDREDRNKPEWPPHPARFFAALAAAHFERADPDHETAEERKRREAEHAALEWLEGQGPVSLSLPNHTDARNTVTAFVPVNDSNEQFKKGAKGKVTVFAKVDEGCELRRNRQERAFPTTVVSDPAVLRYLWETADGDGAARHKDALSRLAAEVTCVGHSSSLVRVALRDEPTESPEPPEPSWRPVERGESAEVTFRVPAAGRLQQLSAAHALSREHVRRIEPPAALARGYVRADQQPGPRSPRTLFDERMVVFRKSTGGRLPLHAALRLTDLVRRALIDLADEPVPEVLCGHRRDGRPTDRPHVAIVPLANVDHRYADGDVKGFALVLPRALRRDRACRDDLRAVYRAAGRLEGNGLTLGRDGHWTVAVVTPDETPLLALRDHQWTRPSRCWATATPVVFGRFPKGRSRCWTELAETHGMVREHCRMIGLVDADGTPVEPQQVEVIEVSPILGVPPSPHFPTLSTDGKPLFPEFGLPGADRRRAGGRSGGRLRAHVFLRFARPVRGPILLGAGRYLGMGFCKPVSNLHGTVGAR